MWKDRQVQVAKEEVRIKQSLARLVEAGKRKQTRLATSDTQQGEEGKVGSVLSKAISLKKISKTSNTYPPKGRIQNFITENLEKGIFPFKICHIRFGFLYPYDFLKSTIENTQA